MHDEAASKAAQQAWLAILDTLSEEQRVAYLAEAVGRGISPKGAKNPYSPEAQDAARELRATIEAIRLARPCTAPPRGWYCTVGHEHSGPCPARPRWWLKLLHPSLIKLDRY